MRVSFHVDWLSRYRGWLRCNDEYQPAVLFIPREHGVKDWNYYFGTVHLFAAEFSRDPFAAASN